MRSVALVVVGGALGTLSRYGVNESVGSAGQFPLATFLVNIVGSFALGVLLAIVLTRRDESMRLLLGTGFLGGFTTYSSLAVETETLLRGDQVALGLAYATGSVIFGLLAALIGVAIGAKARR